MSIVPCTITDAKRFIALHHRHNRPPVSALFAIGLEHDGELIGVATVGRPVARNLDNGRVVEVTRTCVVDGAPLGAVSKLYAACRRAAGVLGWEKCYTYTLVSESGASLRGAGWQLELEIPARPGWDRPGRPRKPGTVDGVAKRRWVAVCQG